MNKKEFINELKLKLDRLTDEEKNVEAEKIDNYIENGKAKQINEEDIIKSLGTIDDLVETIYLKRGIKKDKLTIKDNVFLILKNIKKVFSSKDKNNILKTLGKLTYTILVAIFAKVPFIFVRTVILEYMNSTSIKYEIQNMIAGLFEVVYYFVALVIIYKYLKKYFNNDINI